VISRKMRSKDDGWRFTVEYAKKNAGGQLWLS